MACLVIDTLLWPESDTVLVSFFFFLISMLFMTLKEKYEGMIPYLIFCGRANAILLLFLFKDNRIHY